LSCLGRLLSALLVIVITTIVAVAAGAFGATQFGYSTDTPNALTGAQLRVATLEAENGALKAQNAAVQTQILQLSRQMSSDREQIDGLQEQVRSSAQLSGEVSTRLAADSRERATLVVEMRASRDSVALFATAEAGRSDLLADLRRRSERVERFLQRLSDISQDTALDLNGGTATVVVTATASPSPAPIPTVAEPTTTLIPTLTPTALVTNTALPTIQASPTATALATATASPSPRPTRTLVPAPTRQP
jgi:hypothetical protein